MKISSRHEEDEHPPGEECASNVGRIKYGFQDMSAYMKSDSWNLGVDEELSMVEKRVNELIESTEVILSDVAHHVIDSGGKRLRPSLAILSHHALKGNDLERVVEIAAAIELIHSATLVHDDINDGADMRRGKKAAYKQFGLHEAIVAGDFMFARAFHVGGKFEKEIVDLVAECCAMLAEGEMMQYGHRQNTEVSVDQYIKIIEKKTAQPIKASAQVGAFLANGDGEGVDAFGGYGFNVGIAFQIIDDVLDIVGNKHQLGKMTGSDIREGNMTLPVILARERSEEVRRMLPEVLGMRTIEEERLDTFLETVRSSGGIKSSLKMAREYADKATKYLESIPESIHKSKLEELAYLIVDRSS